MNDLWQDVAAGNFTPLVPGDKSETEEEQRIIDSGVGSGLLAATGNYIPGSEKIYVDIRSLLDARIGAMAAIDQNKTTEVLRSGLYFNRLIDNFAGFDMAEFKKVYFSNNKEVLQGSVVTNVKYLLRRFVKDALLHTIQNRTHEPLVFEVNIYPYTFTEEEIRLLIMCIRFVTYSTSAVRIISLADEDLTPTFCSSNYEVMIRYNWIEWLEKHKKFYESGRTPNMVIIGPELWRDVAPTEQDFIDNGMEKRNPFRETEKLFASLFRLKLYPVSLFCMLESITAENAKGIVDRVSVTEQDIEEYIAENHSGIKVVKENPLPEVPLNLSVEPGPEEDFDLL